MTSSGLVLHRDPDAVRVVTSDISRFYAAFDAAAGKDSAERVRLFRTLYLEPGSVGLRDFMELKVVSPRRLPRRDSLSTQAFDSALVHAAAVQMAAAASRWPRYYASLRSNLKAADTSETLRAAVRPGFRRLSALYPEARYPDLYVVVGALTSGGTASSRGMLLAGEIFSRGPDAHLDELDPSKRLSATIVPPGVFHLFALHEAMHFLQPAQKQGTRTSNLEHALREGGADFITELVSSPWGDVMTYQRYGRAHEREVWSAFAREMRDPQSSRWFYNYGQADNSGSPDLGYWVGYRIAQAYYARASDKRAALRDLLTLNDPERILSLSEYGRSFAGDPPNAPR